MCMLLKQSYLYPKKNYTIGIFISDLNLRKIFIKSLIFQNK